MRSTYIAGTLVLALIGGLVALAIWLVYSTIPDGGSRFERSVTDVKSIEHAVTLFHFKHGTYPETLEELTKPLSDCKPPIIKDASLIVDPWGRPYQYDPKQLHPKTEKPLIWTEGREPGKSQKITNWD